MADTIAPTSHATATSVDEKKAADVENGSTSEGSLEYAEGHLTHIEGVDGAGYQRKLTKRQIMMTVFGAGIGTGLWVGTGTALAYAGPGGIAVMYTIVACIVYLQYVSIGEMTTYKPVHGGFIRQAAEYVDPAFGFALGINFWFAWTMIIPAEITAAISVLKFWPATEAVPLAGYITMILVILIVANVFPVKYYGKIEYCMSWFKILAIFAMIAFMFIMASGGISTAVPSGPLVFHYWKSPGAFNNGIKGLAKAGIQAAFSFGGGEHIAVIAGEARDPRRTIKSTVKPVLWRMVLFFVANIWLVGMCVPYTDSRLLSESGTLASPFVIAIQRAHVPFLPHLLNGFILLTVISCGITSVYIASRSLTAMADSGLVWKQFGWKDQAGRPVVALVVSMTLGGGLTYLNCNDTAQVVYGWFSSLVAIAGLIQWLTIYITHIRFRSGLKAQGISHKSLPFIAPFAPYLQYCGLVILFLIFAAEFYLALYPFGGTGKPEAESFFSAYIAAPLFICDFIGYKIYMKTKFVRGKDMDFREAKVFDRIDEREKEEAERIKEQGGAIEENVGQWELRKRKVTATAKNMIFG